MQIKITGPTNKYWGSGPLPENAGLIGEITRDNGDTGALIYITRGTLHQGNAGVLRSLDQPDARKALLSAVMREHSLGTADIASLVGVTQKAVQHWCNKTRSVPLYALQTLFYTDYLTPKQHQ